MKVERRFLNCAYIAFGSNLGNRVESINRAFSLLKENQSIQLNSVSPLYETSPVGGPQQGDYLNGVFSVLTDLHPSDLLRALLAIEKKMGRIRRVKWAARNIDLDLLAVAPHFLSLRGAKRRGNLNGLDPVEIASTKRRSRTDRLVLQLPHPRYHERAFVLKPFCDIAPAFKHPILKKTNRALLRKLTLVGQRVTMVGSWKKSQYALLKKRKLKKRPLLR